MTLARMWVLVGVVLCALAACEPPADRDSSAVLSAGTPRTAARGEAAADPVPETPETPRTPVAYETMCHHYCATLEETLVYACLAGGNAPADCVERAKGTTELCFDARCVPKLVSPSLCLTQCDTAARFYASFCATPAPAPFCPTPEAEHKRACVAGCGTP